MKKTILLLVLFLSSLHIYAQVPTIDGDMGDVSYTTIGTFTSGRDGFGGTNDLGAIRFFRDGTNIYIGITGELSDNNNIVLFFNFSGYGGRPAGNELDPSGDYEGFVGAFNNGGLDGARMDMEVDYALAFNEGNTTTTLFVDGARYGNGDMLNNAALGSVASQSGTSGSIDAGTTFNGTGNMTLAYNNGFASDTDKGIEFSIPIAAFAGVNNTQSLQLFAIITNSSGFMSNETIPGDPGASNLGDDANLSTIASQDFFTGSFLLPVELTAFQATAGEKHNQLRWTTASEENNSHFEVERSENSKIWKTIGKVQGNGTTLETQSYQFVDEQPLAGTNYYRLKQVDFDGNFEFSDIVVVERGAVISNVLTVFPNPSNNWMTYRVPNNEVVTKVTLLDAFGKLLFTDNAPNGNLAVHSLSSGVYLLVVETNQNRYLQAIVKE